MKKATNFYRKKWGIYFYNKYIVFVFTVFICGKLSGQKQPDWSIISSLVNYNNEYCRNECIKKCGSAAKVKQSRRIGGIVQPPSIPKCYCECDNASSSENSSNPNQSPSGYNPTPNGQAAVNLRSPQEIYDWRQNQQAKQDAIAGNKPQQYNSGQPITGNKNFDGEFNRMIFITYEIAKNSDRRFGRPVGFHQWNPGSTEESLQENERRPGGRAGAVGGFVINPSSQRGSVLGKGQMGFETNTGITGNPNASIYFPVTMKVPGNFDWNLQIIQEQTTISKNRTEINAILPEYRKEIKSLRESGNEQMAQYLEERYSDFDKISKEEPAKPTLPMNNANPAKPARNAKPPCATTKACESEHNQKQIKAGNDFKAAYEEYKKRKEENK
ncbi:MAG: hypothetical protein LBI60_03450 [Bacteroidales bacterium]|jgi:hypothetical protein|nr:hypothetical protein [Bacteroidales bacterium]